MFNYIAIIIHRYTPNETIIRSVIISFIMIILLVTILDLIHEVIKQLPGVYEHKDKEWFVYPSPIALTFGFWAMLNQAKLRNTQFKKLFIYLTPDSLNKYLLKH